MIALVILLALTITALISNFSEPAKPVRKAYIRNHRGQFVGAKRRFYSYQDLRKEVGFND